MQSFSHTIESREHEIEKTYGSDGAKKNNSSDNYNIPTAKKQNLITQD